ncbi:hypothetical protein [Bacillus safensis]|uniref:hypothetical protein n=1 Tax=Bacillus safensis TaxID=561879 RepID=UPI0009BD10BE|nr:hypothetical protein [Bacillus safensis]ARD55361.1 hypothetical protein BRL64_03825 [Bacillus safensis]
MFTYHITNELTLASLQLDDADSLFSLIQKNKAHLGEWLPWVHQCQSVEAVKTFIQSTQTTYNEQKGLEAGIQLNEQLIDPHYQSKPDTAFILKRYIRLSK